MPVVPILIHPEPRLRKVCDPVTSFDGALEELAGSMLATMYDAPGVGLAAPQIGVLQRVVVMDCSGKDADPEPLIMVNPRITWESEERVKGEEGCLSIPDIYEDVERAAEIKVRFRSASGEEDERHLSGIWSICTQHEIDHLNGVLFIDYLSALKRTMITNKMKKLKRERRSA